MTNSIIKVFAGYPCAHRQWRHSGHCRWIHGYQRRFVVTFESDSLDEKGWVIDFGGPTMKSIRSMMDSMFDHTLLLAADDPALPTFEEKNREWAKVIVLPYGPGMEGTARWVFEYIDSEIGTLEPDLLDRGVRVTRVECWENEKNAGIWTVGG